MHLLHNIFPAAYVPRVLKGDTSIAERCGPPPLRSCLQQWISSTIFSRLPTSPECSKETHPSRSGAPRPESLTSVERMWHISDVHSPILIMAFR